MEKLNKILQLINEYPYFESKQFRSFILGLLMRANLTVKHNNIYILQYCLEQVGT